MKFFPSGENGKRSAGFSALLSTVMPMESATVMNRVAFVLGDSCAAPRSSIVVNAAHMNPRDLSLTLRLVDLNIRFAPFVPITSRSVQPLHRALFGHDVTDQKKIFRANWMDRGPPIWYRGSNPPVPIWPPRLCPSICVARPNCGLTAVGLPRSPTGGPKFGWLRTLNISARNCNFSD